MIDLDLAELVYRDEQRAVYKYDGRFYEGTVTDGQVSLREIDGYRIKYLPDGTSEWGGADIKSSKIHIYLLKE